MAEVIEAGAAFDVPAKDGERSRICGAEAGRGAEGGHFLTRQQRAVAGDVEGLAEDARRRGVAERVVIHEHELGIGVEVFVHFIMGEHAGRVALIRPLVIVGRAEVVGVGRRERPQGVAGRLVDDELIGRDPLGREVVADDVGRIGRAGTAAGETRARFSQGAGTVVPVGLLVGFDVAVADIHGGVALAVGRVDPEDASEFSRPAIPGGARREGIVVRGVQGLSNAVVVAVLISADLGVQPDSFEVLHHLEVDDAGDGVRPVHGRGAAGQHFHVVDQGGRNEVQVGDRVGRVARHDAAAVDQHQGAGRAEAAKVDRGDADGAVGHARGLTREHLRQLVQQLFRPGRARQLDVLAAHHGDRAGAGQVRARDARPGDDDFADLGARRSGLREGLAACGQGCAADHG